MKHRYVLTVHLEVEGEEIHSMDYSETWRLLAGIADHVAPGRTVSFVSSDLQKHPTAWMTFVPDRSLEYDGSTNVMRTRKKEEAMKHGADVFRTTEGYRIDWHGSLTFNVYLGDVEVNVFTVETPPAHEVEASRIAEEWWNEGGRDDTQRVLQEGGHDEHTVTLGNRRRCVARHPAWSSQCVMDQEHPGEHDDIDGRSWAS